jgi:hypothetical protein
MQADDWGHAIGTLVQFHVLVVCDGFDCVDDSMWTRCILSDFSRSSGQSTLSSYTVFIHLHTAKTPLSSFFFAFCSIGRFFGGIGGSEIKRRVRNSFDSNSNHPVEYCALQWTVNNNVGRRGSRGHELCPLHIDCRGAMHSDARDSWDLSHDATLTVEQCARLGRSDTSTAAQVRHFSLAWLGTEIHCYDCFL